MVLSIHLRTFRRVDQPIGTGYSIGTPTATNEVEIAEDFIKFFKNFEKTFNIKNFKIYVTGQLSSDSINKLALKTSCFQGESYAGRYVSYISAAMLDAKDKEYYDLSGAVSLYQIEQRLMKLLIKSLKSSCTIHA